MPNGTVRLHRVLRAPRERVFRAFTNADAMAKWIPPYGFTCTVSPIETMASAGQTSMQRVQARLPLRPWAQISGL
mgnify:CR=1 FL=1